MPVLFKASQVSMERPVVFLRVYGQLRITTTEGQQTLDAARPRHGSCLGTREQTISCLFGVEYLCRCSNSFFKSRLIVIALEASQSMAAAN